ncbi:UTP--glucose-1-phosphate uridylyltransferase [Chitinispirillales bacterium ANBcel5]|uniref:UTP--glucose-1-phosphate uridylyltransferase n=1 Tax=Cellulosispirillum alkaliphilum TaxID=3039283 RepID=UPI002A52F706|nr:UTP--glucose-1-phosphate uridylyltransferase [Chitinispirillales bacterium ANBcel5]
MPDATIVKSTMFSEKMKREKLPDSVIDTFLHYFIQLEKGSSGLIPEDKITPLSQSEIKNLEEIKNWDTIGKNALKNCVIIKLNGGLGTTMGLKKAKSLIPVKSSYSFMDITAKQIEYLNSRFNTAIPLLLMNSFKTEEDSLNLLEKYDRIKTDIPFSFLQHKFPKIQCSTLTPASWSQNPSLEWNPPGHGDLYTAFITSNILDKLIESGYKYAFVSNIDNLGASLDTSILGYFSANGYSFMMEVTDRTFMDRKGGHLAKHKNGHLLLRESAQCPDSDKEYFMDIDRHRFFNTNNLWLNLVSLREVLRKRHNFLELPLIVNTKNLDPRDKKSPKVFQIETAMGSAISVFDNATALRVPRSRFAPVKSCEDLLLLWSDYYLLTEDIKIVQNPQRKATHVDINLDPRFYSRIDQLQSRFPNGAPSLLECESLTIKGDVTFGANIKVFGSVIIQNDSDRAIEIKDNTIIDRDLTF